MVGGCKSGPAGLTPGGVWATSSTVSPPRRYSLLRRVTVCRGGFRGEAMPLDAGRVLFHVLAAATMAPVPLATLSVPQSRPREEGPLRQLPQPSPAWPGGSCTAASTGRSTAPESRPCSTRATPAPRGRPTSRPKTCCRRSDSARTELPSSSSSRNLSRPSGIKRWHLSSVAS